MLWWIVLASGRTNGYFLHSVMCSLSVLQVNEGSCLLNMQCVINSDADGYDQVEFGFISTGASVWVEGVVLISQGSKRKLS
ncbi:hypothetical protein IFM89_032684 [Coptis chinensis]|uniref:Uncharacterized protein n=1 Tax=Coptis chinensis TaxID=261450 RepID=A0A835IGZ9_9MAGN|nr:hypothetical protein IFM89_032684 [Coptis chinensis]